MNGEGIFGDPVLMAMTEDGNEHQIPTYQFWDQEGQFLQWSPLPVNDFFLDALWIADLTELHPYPSPHAELCGVLQGMKCPRWLGSLRESQQQCPVLEGANASRAHLTLYIARKGTG